MFNRNTKSLVSSLIAAVLLSATPVAIPAASAQEAIMLETIGAVRMVQPEEARHMTAEQAIPRTSQQGRQAHDARG